VKVLSYSVFLDIANSVALLEASQDLPDCLSDVGSAKVKMLMEH
jgi:hypothetical protein